MKLTFQIIRALMLCCCFAASSVFSEEEQVPLLGLIFEGNFADVEMTQEVAGARKLKLVAAYKGLLGIKAYKKAEWEKEGGSWEAFLTEASKVADWSVERMQPVYIRDSRQVIEYAIIKSDNPFVSSAITSPSFVKAFEDTLGKKLHVVIIDRNVLYVFPASGGKLEEYSESIRQNFNKTPLPVSLEVLEVTKDRFRVIGEIEQPLKTRIKEVNH